MIKTDKKFLLFELLLTLCITVSFILLSLKITLNFKPLYYTDIITLNLQETSNLSNKDIKINYNYVIDYVQSHENQNFLLPTLPSSKEGKIHFQEVKAIFNKLDYIFYTSILIGIIVLFIDRKTNSTYRFLKWSSISILVSPLLCLMPFLLNFDKGFTLFHKLLFNNDYWLLDPKLDPIINIMPQDFFFHSAILIVALLFTFSSVFYIIYKKL